LICGRNDFLKTIDHINNDILIRSNLVILLWLPMIVTTGYVISAPMLRTAYLQVFVKWIERWLGKLEPVPKFQLEHVKVELTEAKAERDALAEALHISRKSSDPSSDILEIVKKINLYASQNLELQNKVKILEAEAYSNKGDLFEINLKYEKNRLAKSIEDLKSEEQLIHKCTDNFVSEWNEALAKSYQSEQKTII
jgi:hypothetical protein